MCKKLLKSQLVCLLVLSQCLPVFAPPPPPIPSLAIAPAGGQVALTWPDTNNWLQSTAFLHSPFSWVNVAATAMVNGNMNTLSLPANQPAMFFRLINSPALPPPTGLVVGSLQDTNGSFYFDLTWNAVPGAASYNVYLATQSGVTKGNYLALSNGMVINNVTNHYLFLPDVPHSVFLPALTAGATYYFVVTAVSPSGPESANSNEGSGLYGPTGAVDGSVFTTLPLGTNLTDMDVPGVLLTLTNAGNPAITATATSGVDGLFTFPALPAGNYQLCWSAHGFISACSNQNITISNGNVTLDPIQIFPDTNTFGLVYGQVSFQNGAGVFDEDAFYQIHVDPVVLLKNAATNLVGRAPVNTSSFYLMAGVPRQPNLTLSLAVEGASVSSNIDTTVTGEADLVISDSPPVIQSIAITNGGQPVTVVPPGTTVQVTVQVSYAGPGANLTYEWFNADGSVAPYPSSPTISWTLPTNIVAFDYVFVRVSDGLGGYDEARITLGTVPQVIFSGQVIGSDTGAPLSNAFVQLNGAVTNTDGDGSFLFQLMPTNEYDLTIASNGYATLTKLLTNDLADQQYRLVKISPASCLFYPSVDPIVVTNASGASLTIPPGSLLDSNDLPYTGCVSVSLDTMDACDPSNPFIGDDFTTNGDLLTAYGFLNITVVDAFNNPLYLNAATNMTLFVPVAPCLGIPGANTADFLTISPQTARWDSIIPGGFQGQIDFVNTHTGYRAFIRRVGRQIAGGVREGINGVVQVANRVLSQGFVVIKPDQSLHVPFEVAFYSANGNQKIRDNAVIQNAAGGLDSTFLLPQGPIQIRVLSLREAPGQAWDITLATPAVIPTENKTVIQVMTPTVPGSFGTTTVIAGVGMGPNRTVQVNALTAAMVAALEPKFLTQVTGTAAKSAAYYGVIDKPNAKSTFKDWQLANGWAASGIGLAGNDDAYAVYFNANYLGAGRRMGMKIKGTSVAYYVATYATLADAEADEAASPKRQPGSPGSKLKYIVCMEYSALNPQDPKADPTQFMKFYAFDATGRERVGEIPDEDRNHPIFVPEGCTMCHGGGAFSNPNGAVDPNAAVLRGDVGGQFIGFDTADYTFSAIDALSRAKLFNNANALNTFNELNNGLTIANATAPPTLRALIAALVGGPTGGYTTSPPNGNAWGAAAADKNLYNQAYAVACRSCHVTLSSQNWRTAAQCRAAGFGTGVRRDSPMPQAQRTFSIFWGSATAASLKANAAPINANAPAAAVVSQPGLMGLRSAATTP